MSAGARGRWLGQTASVGHRARVRLAAAAMLVATLGATSFAPAQTNTTWVGPAVGTWNVVGNWNNGLPNSSTFNAFIDSGAAQNTTVNFTGGIGGLRNLTISSGDRLNMSFPTGPGSVVVSVVGDLVTSTVNNAGTITINQFNILNLASGTSTLTGGGTVILNGGGLTGANGIGTFIMNSVNVNNLVRGFGDIFYVGAGSQTSFFNQSVIRADVAGQTLNVESFPGASRFTNSNLMFAMNGATLQFQANLSLTTFNNTTGTIRAENASFVRLGDRALINGGTLTTTGTGQVVTNHAGANAPRINGVTNTGRIVVQDGGDLLAIGTLTNNGSVTLDGLTDTSRLLASGTLTTLQGGTVLMNGPLSSVGLNGVGLNNVGHIQGQGSIDGAGLQLVNSGTILANITGAVLSVGLGSIQTNNQGTMRATNGGVLRLDGTTTSSSYIQNTSTGLGPTFFTDGGGVIELINNLRIAGGTLVSATGGFMTVPPNENARIESFTTLGGGIIFVAKSASLMIAGAQSNSGTIQMGGTGTGLSVINVDVNSTNTTFTGNGTVHFDGPNAAMTGTGSHRLFNNGNTFIGNGSFGSNGLAITNSATISASGGRLVVDPSNVGTAFFNVGGTVRALSGATLELSGNGGGTFHSTFGALIADAGGTFDITNGAVVQAGSFQANGVINQGGVASFTTMLGGSGTFNTLTNGVSRVQYTRVPRVSIANNASLTTLAGGGTLGTSRLTNNPVITGTGFWNLTDHDLLCDYTGATPLATIRTQLTNGYNSGSWNGTGGINSSFAAASPASMKTALGYAEASEVFTVFPTIFRGLVTDNTTVLVGYTLVGDCNLDRSVNLSDFAALTANYNLPGDWVDGDFNYDGFVDLIDFSAQTANYGLSLPADVPGDFAMVPEPQVIGLLGIASILRRKPRSAHYLV